MSHNVLELKLKKKLLRQQLEILDSRVGRLGAIREKKLRAVRRLPDDQEKQLHDEQRRQALRQQRRDAGQTRPIHQFDRRAPHREERRQVAVLKAAPKPIRPGGHLDRMRKRDVLVRTKQRLEAGDHKRERRRPQEPRKHEATGLRLPEPLFVARYTRGELPSICEHVASGFALSWVAPPPSLDYGYYLPMFVEGLRCKKDPYKFVARQGTLELLEAARGYPERIIPLVERLIPPLRAAVSTGGEDVHVAVLQTLRAMVLSNPGVGEALVPHLRQLLLTFKKYYEMSGSAGLRLEEKQRSGSADISTLTSETLQLLEKTGGSGAFKAIKWLIPTYQSCM
uniref:Uncharacterized protein n=1 Tax=Pinguiococcus pyrenoidosus TaxID=172671 RepID=A0A7R9U2T4_9STRA|mmetsp:Transcript_12047/g.44709  ORF Transcript_12047/g.44709 Transcript_12047/m.44709 type:complete len:339 (+) Transcript_12047:1104-2120(+)